MSAQDLYVDEAFTSPDSLPNRGWKDFVLALVGSIVDLIFGTGGGTRDDGDSYTS